MNKCDVCKKPFKNSRGVAVHKNRTPACGGKKVVWSQSARRKKTTKHLGARGETGREAIHEILGDHPQGLPVSKISTRLKDRGFHVASQYITQVASTDPSIIRVKRGIYRLKGSRSSEPLRNSGTKVVQDAVNEVKAETRLTLPRETLLLRIETLESQNRALLDAHMSLVRGVFV